MSAICRRQVHVTVSYSRLAKLIVGSAFATLTLCGVAAPFLGISFTSGGELLAAGGGGLIGAVSVLRR